MYRGAMPLKKLANANVFVVRDLDNEAPALGSIRSAAKVLQDPAKDLARVQTYQCAVLNMKYQGASVGVSAPPESRDETLAAVAEELLSEVSAGSLMLDPGMGVSLEQMGSLPAADVRNEARTRPIEGILSSVRLAALGAVACASKAHSLDGASVAIENFDETGAAIAREAVARGARIVGISTSAGAALDPNGFALERLLAAIGDPATDPVRALTDEPLPFWRILGVATDVLFAGSKAGLIDHKGAENVKAKVVVPTGPIPYTTKGALVLERRGSTVLPDFVTTAGSLFPGLPPAGDDPASLTQSVNDLLGTLTESLLGRSTSPILEACKAAESFLRTWRDALPFGRPFAP